MTPAPSDDAKLRRSINLKELGERSSQLRGDGIIGVTPTGEGRASGSNEVA